MFINSIKKIILLSFFIFSLNSLAENFVISVEKKDEKYGLKSPIDARLILYKRDPALVKKEFDNWQNKFMEENKLTKEDVMYKVLPSNLDVELKKGLKIIEDNEFTHEAITFDDDWHLPKELYWGFSIWAKHPDPRNIFSVTGVVSYVDPIETKGGYTYKILYLPRDESCPEGTTKTGNSCLLVEKTK